MLGGVFAFENFTSPMHVGLAMMPILVYWVCSAFYMSVVPPQGKMPRSTLHVVGAVIVQQAMQFFLTCVTMPPEPPTALGLGSWGLLGLAIRFGVFVALFDSWEYFMHRYMHENRWLYKHVHSVHHQLLDNRPFAALYNHPIEALLMDTLGSVFAMAVAGLTPLAFTMVGSFATAKTVHDHVGTSPLRYDPFLFFQNNAKYHAVHHRKFTKNYAQPFFSFWDRTLGTYHDDSMSTDNTPTITTATTKSS